MSDERHHRPVVQRTMGNFDAEGNYIPRRITEDDLAGAPSKT